MKTEPMLLSNAKKLPHLLGANLPTLSNSLNNGLWNLTLIIPFRPTLLSFRSQSPLTYPYYLCPQHGQVDASAQMRLRQSEVDFSIFNAELPISLFDFKSVTWALTKAHRMGGKLLGSSFPCKSWQYKSNDCFYKSFWWFYKMLSLQQFYIFHLNKMIKMCWIVLELSSHTMAY